MVIISLMRLSRAVLSYMQIAVPSIISSMPAYVSVKNRILYQTSHDPAHIIPTLTSRRPLFAQQHRRNCGEHKTERVHHRHAQRQFGRLQHAHVQQAARLVQGERHHVLPTAGQEEQLTPEAFDGRRGAYGVDADATASNQRIGGAPQEADENEGGCGAM